MIDLDEKALEAAARAMCSEGGYDPDEIMPNDGPRLRYYLAGARAAISAYLAAAGDGWRPIESAPKDGTRILGWMQFKDAYGKMNTGEPLVVAYVEAPDKADYVWWTLDGYYHRDAFCFWRPLPTPPEQETDARAIRQEDGG